MIDLRIMHASASVAAKYGITSRSATPAEAAQFLFECPNCQGTGNQLWQHEDEHDDCPGCVGGVVVPVEAVEAVKAVESELTDTTTNQRIRVSLAEAFRKFMEETDE